LICLENQGPFYDIRGARGALERVRGRLAFTLSYQLKGFSVGLFED
jgi:hypothetical protein